MSYMNYVSALSAPDPFILAGIPGAVVWRQTALASPRTQVINPAQKTLVLIVAGQSIWMNVTPTTYLPTNSTAIDAFNIYDGGSYSIVGALPGTTEATSQGFGVGTIAARLADTFVTNGVFNRVILVPIAFGGTSVADWATGGVLVDRIPATLRRLASRGITNATPGVTLGLLWGQGENDTLAGTSQAAYAASLTAVFSNATAAGFSGRFFVCKESWDLGAPSAAIQNAQVGMVNGINIFSGGNLDAFDNTYRSDTTHPNDTGAASFASTVYTAMRASGAPY